MRPNWQVFQARELTARAQPSTLREEAGERVVATQAGEPGSHMVGALIVRQLVALNPGLDTAMLSVPQATQEDLASADKPEAFVRAMGKMWTSVGVPATGTSDPVRVSQALWELARVAYLSLPPQEIEAAREIAARSVPLPWYGSRTVKAESGKEEIIGGGGWDIPAPWDDGSTAAAAAEAEAEAISMATTGLSTALGGFGAGFGSLRSELAASTPEATRADVLRAFDGLVSNASARKTLVKKWQTWAKSQIRSAGPVYAGAIDGLWGPKSEAAWNTFSPLSYGQPTTLADLRAMAYGDLEILSLLAAGIARDKWVPANLSRLPPPPASATEPTRVEITTSTVSEDDDGVTITPVPPEEEDVVVHPEEEETGEPPPAPPTRVEITPTGWGPDTQVSVVPVEEPGTTGAPGAAGVPTKRSWVPWAVGIGATALIVGAVVLKGGKQPYEEG